MTDSFNTWGLPRSRRRARRPHGIARGAFPCFLSGGGGAYNGAVVSAPPRLILASASPRRKDLLRALGVPFRVLPSRVDEVPRPGESPTRFVARAAFEKAEEVAGRRPSSWVLSADTIVVVDGEILGKPKDLHDAERMLKLLRGRDHIVYTGLCARQNAKKWTRIVQTTITMRPYSDADIAAYIATGNPLDKAAAYAIQHNGFRPVANVSGCYANVMGLPLCHLARTLRAMKVEPMADVPTACQSHLRYSCPVFADILSRG